MSKKTFTMQEVFELRDALRIFHDEIAVDVGSIPWPPPKNSPAATEIASLTKGEGIEEINNALRQGVLLVESAADHLMLFTKAIDEPLQTLALMTCVRGVLEASAYAIWLLDPSIGAVERIARSLGRRKHALRELKKFSDKTGVEAFPERAKKRIEAVDFKATSLGILPANVPSTTDMIRMALDKEALYRILSAVAHGHAWALVQVGFKAPISGANADEEALNITKQMNPQFVWTFGLQGLQAIKRALWFLVTLFGLDQIKLAEIIDAFYERIGAIPKKNLYWRIP